MSEEPYKTDAHLLTDGNPNPDRARRRDAREERLAAALRANLRRRKAALGDERRRPDESEA